MSGPWEDFAKKTPQNNRAPSEDAGPWMDYSLGAQNLGPDSGAVSEGAIEVPTEMQEQAPQSSLGDQMETQLQNFGNVIAANHLPHIRAVFEKYLSPDATAKVDEELRAKGFDIPERTYTNMRDENIKAQEAQNARNPESAMIGTAAGILTQAPLIAKTAVNMLGKGATIASRAKDAGTMGFALGAANNPGDVEGVFNPLQGEERLSGGIKGAGFGVAGQGVGEGVAKAGEVVKNAPKTFDKLANASAFKATGAMLKDFRAAFGKNSADEVGKTLLAKKIVQAGDTLDDIAIKTSAAKQEAGQAIRSVYDKVNTFIKGSGPQQLSPRQQAVLDSTKLNGTKIAGEARVAVLKAFKNSPGNTEAKAKVLAALDDVAAMGDDIDLPDLIEARMGIDEQINYSRKVGDMPIVQQQLKTLRDSLHKAIQNRVRAVGVVVKDKKLIEELRTANKEYGHLATAEKTVIDRINRTDANNFFSLGDKIVGAAAGAGDVTRAESPEDAVKSLLKGFVVATASKYGRTYGPAMLASTSKAFGEALKKPANFAKYGEPLIEAAKRSPQEFQALLNQFGKEPEFIKLATPAGAR
jgi:hypothetical protein